MLPPMEELGCECPCGGAILVRHKPDGSLAALFPTATAQEADLFNLAEGAAETTPRGPRSCGAKLLVSTMPFDALRTAWSDEGLCEPVEAEGELANGTAVRISGLTTLPSLKFNDHEGSIEGYYRDADR